MNETLIKNGRVLNPATGFDQEADVRIVDGCIAEVKPRIRVRKGVQLIDATSCLVLPGLIDMHTHLRIPGGEYKETILTGTAAAAAGGFTSVTCMANTQPVNDNAAVTRLIRSEIEKEAVVGVNVVGAGTKGLKGEGLAQIGAMAQQGIVAVSDDGHCIIASRMMRRVLEYAKTFGLPVIVHAEDSDLAGAPGINEGLVSTQLGLRGSPSTAETLMVARDCQLAALTKAHLHVAHVSAGESVELIERAKQKGISVTCEVTPHHLALTEEATLGFNTFAKVNPPLRTHTDRRLLIRGLKEGIIDVIATDHAPHSPIEKEVAFEAAAPGMIGLETALSLVWGVAQEFSIPALDLIAKLTCNPAKILGLDGKGRLEVGADGDVTVFDPRAEWSVEPAHIRSRSHNTPFVGHKLRGRVMKTLVAGDLVYEVEN